MILIFVQGSDALAIDNDHINFLSLGRGALDRSSPTPKTFSAGVDGGPNAKAATLIQKHSIEQVGFSCSVQASDRDYSEWFLDLAEEISTVWMNFVL